MKTIRMLGLVLGAVFAFGAILATTASAETTLLAEWLIKKVAVVGEPEIVTTGEILLEDTKTIVAKAAVLCVGHLDGVVTNESGLAFILLVLNIAGVEILELEGTGILCSAEEPVVGCAAATEASPIEVWPLDLPWHLEIFLMELGEILALILEAGWHVLCLILGINAEDECLATEFELGPLTNDASGFVLLETNERASKNGLCSQSNEETGIIETEGDTAIRTANGETLEVSSE